MKTNVINRLYSLQFEPVDILNCYTDNALADKQSTFNWMDGVDYNKILYLKERESPYNNQLTYKDIGTDTKFRISSALIAYDNPNNGHYYNFSHCNDDLSYVLPPYAKIRVKATKFILSKDEIDIEHSLNDTDVDNKQTIKYEYEDTGDHYRLRTERYYEDFNFFLYPLAKWNTPTISGKKLIKPWSLR